MCIIKPISFNGLKKQDSVLSDESGSALYIVILTLFVLTMVAGTSSKISIDEVKIAANDRRYQITKSEADGATELASELLEQNIACASGFTNLQRGGLIQVVTGSEAFWQNTRSAITTPDSQDSERDFYIPIGYTTGEPHTNFTLGGFTRFALGAAIQMAAGYEGKGKGAAASGGQRVYEIFTQRKGLLDSEAVCRCEWRHVIGSEGVCVN